MKMSKKDMSNEQLARMMAKGFENVDNRFDRIENRLENVESDIEEINLKFDHVAHKFEVKDLERRVTILENKDKSK